MRRPRRVRVSAALSAGGGGDTAELVAAAVSSRSLMSEPPDALDLSTQRLLPSLPSSAQWPRPLKRRIGRSERCWSGMLREAER